MPAIAFVNQFVASDVADYVEPVSATALAAAVGNSRPCALGHLIRTAAPVRDTPGNAFRKANDRCSLARRRLLLRLHRDHKASARVRMIAE